MQRLARPSTRLVGLAFQLHHARTPRAPSHTCLRLYAKKAAKGGQSTSNLVPRSQQKLSGGALKEYEATDAKMKLSVEWFRKEARTAETRASGRITPDLLHPVRVVLPGRANPARLEEIATVGIREGTTLLVTVFEEDNLKHVEKALYSAKLPHVVPQRMDSRTIRIPMPKPTVEARKESLLALSKQAEEARTQIRKAHQAGVKKGKFEKHSVELDEFQLLSGHRISDVDTTLLDLKNTLGSK